MRCYFLPIVAVLGLGALLHSAAADAVIPPLLPRAHAHNDYLHPRPLLDALDQGFTSVEADIYLVQDRLLVAHEPSQISPERTLERLYLDPLLERVTRHQGQVHPQPAPFTLMIDIKSEATATYAALRTVLARYAGMLTRFEHDQIKTNAVTIILSGNRPQQVLAQEPLRYAALDGRLSDLTNGLSVALMPLISDNWRNHFRWRGEGPPPAQEQAQLRQWVDQAHRQGRRIRFWAIPDSPAGWQVVHQAGVDLINTDRLAQLRAFLRSTEPVSQPDKK